MQTTFIFQLKQDFPEATQDCIDRIVSRARLILDPEHEALSWRQFADVNHTWLSDLTDLFPTIQLPEPIDIDTYYRPPPLTSSRGEVSSTPLSYLILHAQVCLVSTHLPTSCV
jgi:hypothetical protein